MPKTAVETRVCDICGVGVREGSLFCYNCGGSVSKAHEVAEAEPVPRPAEPVVAGEAPINGHSRGTNYDPAKRKSERNDRRKVRASNRQPAEIVWEPRTGVSWAFVISAVVFLLIALVAVIAAYYMK